MFQFSCCNNNPVLKKYVYTLIFIPLLQYIHTEVKHIYLPISHLDDELVNTRLSCLGRDLVCFCPAQNTNPIEPL